MAHYAFLDENNIVTEVIVGKDETELIDGLTPEEWYGNFRGQKCVRTSYNTSGNTHKLNDIPFRGNYAGIGMFYDKLKDVFYVLQSPFTGWILNQETYIWEAPVPMPTDDKMYVWDETTVSWVEVQ
jgi:hypothetical protein